MMSVRPLVALCCGARVSTAIAIGPVLWGSATRREDDTGRLQWRRVEGLVRSGVRAQCAERFTSLSVSLCPSVPFLSVSLSLG